MLFPNLNDLSNFELIHSLGQGYSSDVNLYRHISSQQLVAIKHFTNKNTTQQQTTMAYENELKLLEHLKGCDNIVQILGFGQIATIDSKGRRPRVINNYFIIMEYIETEHLPQNNEEQVRIFFQKLIQVLIKVHKKGIVHRDLNLNNVLIKNGEPVLIDFTFGCMDDGRHKMNEFYGTAPFIAPEIVDGAPHYTRPAEVYSLGIILSLIIQSNEAKDLIESMTCQNPYKRPILESILDHPWMKGTN